MAFNQFLGLSGGGGGGGGGVGGGGARGPKGDPGSFVWSFGNPPNVTDHFRLYEDEVTFLKSVVPDQGEGGDGVVSAGSSERPFYKVHARAVHTNELRFDDGEVSVSYDATDGRHRIRVGSDYEVFGVTTLRENPDKIDPRYIDFTGLRFVDVVPGDQDLDQLARERPLLQPGDYFVVRTAGQLNYPLFDDEDNAASRGDILVFSSERFFKVPFRIPDHGVSTAHLTDGAVTSEKLQDDSVHTRHLRDGAVTSSKITPEGLEVPSMRVRRAFSSPSFCSTSTSTEDAAAAADGSGSGDVDPLANPAHGIIFAPTPEDVNLGTWRLMATVEALKFEIWTGTKWANKFELR